MTELKGKGFTLRPWKDGDQESLVANANNKKLWMNMISTFPHPYTRKDADWWIKHCQEPEKKDSIFAIEIDRKAVGCIEVSKRESDSSREKTCTMGYWIGEKYWGKGIMTRAVRLAVDYAFKNFDIIRVQASVYEWNPASARVLEKNGFTLEGRLRKAVFKDGKIGDELIYGKLREEQ